MAEEMDTQLERGLPAAETQPLARPRVRPRPRWHGYTAFVFSGGGARGALQVGALRALLERDIHPDVLVGTSIGGWNAALLARVPTLAGVELLETIWRSLTPANVMLGYDPRVPIVNGSGGALMLSALQRIYRGHSSLYNDVGLRQLIQRYLGGVTFEELRLPLRLIAADLSKGERAVFSTGPVAPAVLASSAIPGIFPPVQIGDSVYVDGGALDNLSIETALDLGARRVFLLDVGHDAIGEGPAYWTRALTTGPDRGRGGSMHPLEVLIERTLQVMNHYHGARALERVPRGIELHVLRLATRGEQGGLAFGHASKWMEMGYATTNIYLDAAFPPPLTVASLNPHELVEATRASDD